MKHNRIHVCMFILLTISVCCLQGSQSQVVPKKFKVAVFAGGFNDDNDSEKRLNNLISSYTKRELRSLGDVEIVDPLTLQVRTLQYAITIMAMEVKIDGSKTGLVAIAHRLSERVPPSRFNDRWREYYTKFPAFKLSQVSVSTIGRARIDEVCKEIVADFDTELLEPERLLRR